jgi:hypothetical protein
MGNNANRRSERSMVVRGMAWDRAIAGHVWQGPRVVYREWLVSSHISSTWVKPNKSHPQLLDVLIVSCLLLPLFASLSFFHPSYLAGLSHTPGERIVLVSLARNSPSIKGSALPFPPPPCREQGGARPGTPHNTHHSSPLLFLSLLSTLAR